MGWPELDVWVISTVQMQALKPIVPTISVRQSWEARAIHSTLGMTSAVLASASAMGMGMISAAPASRAWLSVAACSQGLWQLSVLAVGQLPPCAAE